MAMPGRSFSAGTQYRYGFNGKEKDNEAKGEGNQISFEFRTYDTRLGRFSSPDPKEILYPWQSTYSYYKNNPVSEIDFLGMGEYYSKSGKDLGSDDKMVKDKKGKMVSDNKAYIADDVVIAKDGKKSFTNAKELSVSNTELNIFANVIAEESGGDKEESYAIASSTLNYKKEMKYPDLLTTYRSGIYGYNNNKHGSNYMNNADYGMEAAINALTGGIDYSNGAIQWDGFDFPKKGFDHIKGTNDGLNISAEHLATLKSWPLYKNYNPSNALTPGIHLATSGDNAGMCLYSSTAAHGGTIFWGKNGKDFVYLGKPINNGLIGGFVSGKGCITIEKFYPNKKFTGHW